MKFRAVLQLEGKTATGIRVPDEIVASLAGGKRPAVRATLGDFTYRTTVAPMGGAFWIPVSAEVRGKAGVVAWDEIDVDLELDTEPREVTVPSDFNELLAVDSVARRAFDGLSYSNKRRIVSSIDDAKTAETRQRRIRKAVDSLREENR